MDHRRDDCHIERLGLHGRARKDVAEKVVAAHSASHLASSVQARDGLVVGADAGGFRVGEGTNHAIVNHRRDDCHPPQFEGQKSRPFLTFKFFGANVGGVRVDEETFHAVVVHRRDDCHIERLGLHGRARNDVAERVVSVHSASHLASNVQARDG